MNAAKETNTYLAEGRWNVTIASPKASSPDKHSLGVRGSKLFCDKGIVSSDGAACFPRSTSCALIWLERICGPLPR